VSETNKLERLHQELTALEGLLPYLAAERRTRVEQLIADLRQQVANAEKRETILAALRDAA
jgi:hypothetical protein